MAYVTRIATTDEGYLYVEVDFDDGHLNDFIFPDLTSEHDVETTVIRVIRQWRSAHPEASGDHRSPQISLSDLDPKGAVALVKHLEGMTL